jgi:hypothetical protein
MRTGTPEGTVHASGTTPPRWRRLAATALAALTLALVALQVLAGAHTAEKERASVARAVAAMPRDRTGHTYFVVRGVPEPFIQFVARRVPAGDTVEYVVDGISSCKPVGRVFGRMLWLQFREAPRPTVCGARYRVYVNSPVPEAVPAQDRFGARYAVTRT